MIVRIFLLDCFATSTKVVYLYTMPFPWSSQTKHSIYISPTFCTLKTDHILEEWSKNKNLIQFNSIQLKKLGKLNFNILSTAHGYLRLTKLCHKQVHISNLSSHVKLCLSQIFFFFLNQPKHKYKTKRIRSHQTHIFDKFVPAVFPLLKQEQQNIQSLG